MLFSGEFSQVGVQIEELTAQIWEVFVQPVLNKVPTTYLRAVSSD